MSHQVTVLGAANKVALSVIATSVTQIDSKYPTIDAVYA